MPGDTRRGLAGVLRWAARIVGLLTSVGALVAIIAGTAVDLASGEWQELSTGDAVAGAFIAVIAAVGLAGCFVSWWRERLAAVFLVVASAAMGIHIALLAGRNHFFVWLVMGLPYLIAAVLLLGSWRISRRT